MILATKENTRASHNVFIDGFILASPYGKRGNLRIANKKSKEQNNSSSRPKGVLVPRQLVKLVEGFSTPLWKVVSHKGQEAQDAGSSRHFQESPTHTRNGIVQQHSKMAFQAEKGAGLNFQAYLTITRWSEDMKIPNTNSKVQPCPTWKKPVLGAFQFQSINTDNRRSNGCCNTEEFLAIFSSKEQRQSYPEYPQLPDLPMLHAAYSWVVLQ